MLSMTAAKKTKSYGINAWGSSTKKVNSLLLATTSPKLLRGQYGRTKAINYRRSKMVNVQCGTPQFSRLKEKARRADGAKNMKLIKLC